MKITKLHRRGFSLVELSVGLVIVGLLIGGLLMGQSMMTTGKILKQVRQLQVWDSEVSNFVATYNVEPGGSTILGCSLGTSCGDKRIWDYYANAGGRKPWYWFDEIANFWPQLGANGYSQDNAQFTSTLTASGFTITGNVRNSPRAEIDSKTGVVVGTSIVTGMAYGTKDVAIYQLADQSNISSSDYNIQCNERGSIIPTDAMALDAKLDDGKPYTGYINSADVNGCAWGSYYFGQPGSGDGCTIPPHTAYNIANKNRVCALSIQVLPKSAELKPRVE